MAHLLQVLPAEEKEIEPPPEQWTMTPLKLEKDGLKIKKACCGTKAPWLWGSVFLSAGQGSGKVP